MSLEPNLEKLTAKKIYAQERLMKLIHIWKFKGESIVFTNGCYDLLHPGHLHLLLHAAQQGTKLVVGINSDTSIKNIKDDKRPIIDENGRLLQIASLWYVDAVVLYQDKTPLKLIEMIKPSFLVKGADYKEADIVGADFVKKEGGKIVTVSLLENYSTTQIINKIIKFDKI